MYPYKSHAKHEILENWEQAEVENEIEAADFSFNREDRGPAPNMHPGRPPVSRPPRALPKREHGHKNISHRELKRCEGNLAFLWLRGERDIWVHITYVSRDRVYGYSWTPLGWKYTDFNMRRIESFFCFG